MNKKVSTIFAMAALMGGAFCGSAYAQMLDPIAFPIGDGLDKVSNGQAVIFKQGNVSLGLTKGINDYQAQVAPISNVNSDPVEKTEARNYTWITNVIPSDDVTAYNRYMFVNAVTGDTLSFDAGGNLLLKNEDPTLPAGAPRSWAKEGSYTFSFGNTAANYGGASVLVAESSRAAGTLSFVDFATQKLASSAAAVALHKLDLLEVAGYELNKLYNGKGFNLAAEKVSGISADVEDNLFYGENPIWAYTLDNDYTVGTQDNGDKLTIPAGTYFFTKVVFSSDKSASDFMPDALGNVNAGPGNINWLASTLIAVSPTIVGESTDVNRAAGEGFKLIEVPGKDFIFQSNTSIPEGADIYITNACFTVESDHSANADYPYALSLGTFYYQKSAKYAGTDDQTAVSVYLGVTSYDNSRQNVATKTGTATHSFSLNASSVVDGKDLLNDTKTAAVYNIKVVDGPAAAKDLINKYLTVGSNGYFGSTGRVNATDFQWEAKGAAITELDYPIFQFVITSAKQEPGSDKYVNVTFTNRETGENFTTQLFKEDGENRYSLSTTIENVVPYTVNTVSANTYEVAPQAKAEINADVIIELEKVETVDRYAGFLNIDNESIRTLAFARDVNDTSNKLYSVVDSDNLTLNADDEFTNDVNEATQWQLVKSENPLSISRVFVYNNTATQSVDDVANGDVVSAYVYALRYVEDGDATNFFLSNDYTRTSSRDLEYKTNNEIETLRKDLSKSANADINFIIKENVDGSISLIERDGAFNSSVSTGSYKYVAPFDAQKNIETSVSNWMGKKVASYIFSYEDVYASTSSANEVKTYLDPQKVEISWPAHEGHVTLMSELGNYINMNEDHDGIVVNENDGDTYYLYVTDKDAIVPSFYITKGIGSENGERMYMFNPTDSASYYVAEGAYNKKYQWNEKATKVIFKPGVINETRDTLTLTVKGEADKKVAMEADDNDKNIWGGLNRFKWQIIEAEDAEGMYYIRQPKARNNGLDNGVEGIYLSNLNDKLTWSGKTKALLFQIENAAAPTANEGVSATEVKIIATDGAVNVKNAAGKNVVISTILGQIVANEVLTSDNATISGCQSKREVRRNK